jgi:hypothetical protein
MIRYISILVNGSSSISSRSSKRRGLFKGSLVGLRETLSARWEDIMCGFRSEGGMHPCSFQRAEYPGWKPFLIDLIVFHFSFGSPPASSSSVSIRNWASSFAAPRLMFLCNVVLAGQWDDMDSSVCVDSILSQVGGGIHGFLCWTGWVLSLALAEFLKTSSRIFDCESMGWEENHVGSAVGGTVMILSMGLRSVCRCERLLVSLLCPPFRQLSHFLPHLCGLGPIWRRVVLFALHVARVGPFF